MNTAPKTSRSAHFAAFAIAAVMTVAMLGSVERLATSQAPAGLIAQVEHAAARG